VKRVVLSLSCSLEEGARGTGVWKRGFRWHEPQFGPDGLARKKIIDYAPAVRERVHEEQPTARLRVRCGFLEFGPLLTPRVRDLDTEGVAGQVERQAEVAAADPAVGDGVGGQLGHEEPSGV
jgi:hypothetical protein